MSSRQMLQLGFKAEPNNDGTTPNSSSSSGSTSSSIMDVQSTTTINRKRAPQHDEGGSSSVVDPRERIAAVRKRILEHKHLRLKSVKERHAEHVAEWFYLQTGANLMDYQVWRKKPQTPELINYMRSHRLESPSAAAADDGSHHHQNMSTVRVQSK